MIYLVVGFFADSRETWTHHCSAARPGVAAARAVCELMAERRWEGDDGADIMVAGVAELTDGQMSSAPVDDRLISGREVLEIWGND